MEKLTQIQSVINAMKQNGGYATFKELYSLVPTAGWKTKTPEASIRRIVQISKYFFKVQSGMWALNEYKDKLPKFKVTVGNKLVLVSNFKEASDVCMDCISEMDLGATEYFELGIGKVYENDKYVGHISYNGRMWKGEYSNPIEEIFE